MIDTTATQKIENVTKRALDQVASATASAQVRLKQHEVNVSNKAKRQLRLEHKLDEILSSVIAGTQNIVLLHQTDAVTQLVEARAAAGQSTVLFDFTDNDCSMRVFLNTDGVQIVIDLQVVSSCQSVGGPTSWVQSYFEHTFSSLDDCESKKGLFFHLFHANVWRDNRLYGLDEDMPLMSSSRNRSVTTYQLQNWSENTPEVAGTQMEENISFDLNSFDSLYPNLILMQYLAQCADETYLSDSFESALAAMV